MAGRQNTKLVAMIKGHEVAASSRPNHIRLRSPEGTNFSLDVEVLMELATRLHNDPMFVQQLNLGQRRQ